MDEWVNVCMGECRVLSARQPTPGLRLYGVCVNRYVYMGVCRDGWVHRSLDAWVGDDGCICMGAWMSGCMCRCGMCVWWWYCVCACDGGIV